MDYIIKPKLEKFFQTYFTLKDMKINVFKEISLSNVELNLSYIN